jgi:hypothetical protein
MTGRTIINRWDRAVKSFNDYVEKDSVITKFKTVNTEDVNFDNFDTETINIAMRYAMAGLNAELSLKYAREYGRKGLMLIGDLQRDLKIKIL